MTPRLVVIASYMAALVVLLDQFTKMAVLRHFKGREPFEKVNEYFNLVVTWNKGVTFGILNEHGSLEAYAPFILVALAVVIVLFLVHWLLKAETKTIAIALGLIIGGAAGNIIDRLGYGAVLDFLDFHYDTYHWYAFNLADSAIVCGVMILFCDHLVKWWRTR